MFIVIRRYDVPETSIKEVLDKSQKGFLPELKKIPGFIDYYYGYSNGVAMTVGLFDSRAGADQSNRLAADWVQKYVPGLYSGPPQTFEGDVVLRATSEQKKAA